MFFLQPEPDFGIEFLFWALSFHRFVTVVYFCDQLAWVSDLDLPERNPLLSAITLYFLNNVFSFCNLPKDNVLAVQPWAFDCCYKKLWIICVVLSTIGHGKNKRFIVLMIKILIPKLLSIYTLASCPITIDYIACLNQETRNNPVEVVPLIV